MSRRPQGFTLIELVITVAILGVLALAVLPVAETTVKRAKESELRSGLREIRGALDAYKRAWEEGRVPRAVGQSGYPPTLEALVQGVVDPKDPKGARIYFLRRLPRDLILLAFNVALIFAPNLDLLGHRAILDCRPRPRQRHQCRIRDGRAAQQLMQRMLAINALAQHPFKLQGCEQPGIYPR